MTNLETSVAFNVIDECFEHILEDDEVPPHAKLKVRQYRNDFREMSREFFLKYDDIYKTLELLDEQYGPRQQV